MEKLIFILMKFILLEMVLKKLRKEYRIVIQNLQKKI